MITNDWQQSIKDLLLRNNMQLGRVENINTSFKKVNNQYTASTNLCHIVIEKLYGRYRTEASLKGTGEAFYGYARLLAEAKKNVTAIDDEISEILEQRRIQEEKEDQLSSNRSLKISSYAEALVLPSHMTCLLAKKLKIGSRVEISMTSKPNCISEVIYDWLDGYDYAIECEKLHYQLAGTSQKRIKSLAEIEKIVEISNDDFDAFGKELMCRDLFSKSDIASGGTISDCKISNDYCEKERAKFLAKENNPRNLVTMVTSKNRRSFFVNASGYNYARNVGVYVNIMEK